MVQAEQRAAAAPARGGHPVRALVLDIAAPIAAYYGIRAAGGSVWFALAAGGILPAASTIYFAGAGFWRILIAGTDSPAAAMSVTPCSSGRS